jgi:CheY-like chemotaxis protein
LDINMPGMDGLEFLAAIRAEDSLRHLPVVMCSTSSYDKDIERAKRLGASGYVTKPTDLAKLKPAIEAIASLRLAPEDAGHALLRAA